MSPDSYFDPDPRHDLSKNQYLNFDSPRYFVSGAFVYTLITSYAMHVRILKSLLVGSPKAPSALMLCRLAVDGAVAMCSAGALRAMVRAAQASPTTAIAKPRAV